MKDLAPIKEKHGLRLGQKVTVLDKDGEPLAAGTVELFRTADGTRGPVDLVVVREAGLNSIVALPPQIRAWQEGDPEPQERRFIDPPGAFGRKLPSTRHPVVAGAPDPEPDPRPHPATPATPATPEPFDLGDVLGQMADELRGLDA